MPNYPYDDLGTPLDTTNLERLNNNYEQIQADIQSVSSSTTQSVNALQEDVNAKLTAQKNEYTGRLNLQYDDYNTRLNVQKQEINNLVVDGDSSPEAAQARVGLYGEDYDTLKNRIDGDLTDIAVGQINKNRGKFDQSFLADELLSQIAGTAPINATPAPNSVTIGQTAFYTRSSNLFNKGVISNDSYVSGTNGNLVALAGYITSDYIFIKPSTRYTVKARRYVAFYNSAKVFISGISNVYSQEITTPSNAYYVRFAWFPANDAVTNDQQQMNEGSSLLPYEAYKEYIPKNYIESFFDPTVVPIQSLEIGKMAYASLGNNLFDKNTAELDKNLSFSNGSTTAATGFVTSPYIPVLNGQYFIKNARSVAFYDTSKAFISGSSIPNPFIDVVVSAPTNAKFMRFSWFLSNLALSVQMVNIGNQPKPYEEYGFRINQNVLPLSSATGGATVELLLPTTIYALVGKELNIYFDNIFTAKDSEYSFDVTCSVGQQLKDRYRLNATASGTFSFSVRALKNGTEVAAASTTIVVKASSVGTGVNKKVLFIGDSTTAIGTPIVKLNENFNSDPMDITVLGTRGTAPNNHEAIAGWTARFFRIYANDPVVTTSLNGFFNPAINDFDFTFYMNQKGYASVDYVFINLGINDVFSYTDDATLQTKITEFIADYDYFIASIKAFNANIKIGVCLTIPPNYSQDAFGKAYGNGQTRDRYKQNNFQLVKALFSKYRNQESNNIYLVPIHTNIDTKNNFGVEQEQINARNTTMIDRPTAYSGVHPGDPGYWQIADVYWYWLKSFES